MKRYTVEEAQALLPELSLILEELRGAFLALRDIQVTMAAHSRGASGDGHLLADPFEVIEGVNPVEVLQTRLERAVARLDRWGIEVKDPAKGLVDFFHEREGRTVYLCYLLGETEVAYWHELDAGFAGRQPL